MTVSIIIAVKTWGQHLEECVNKCLALDYPDYEILIMPDKLFKETLAAKQGVSVKVIPTGNVSPAEKRDMALNHAKGEILAFLDDDTYPRKDWLKEAVKKFENVEVAAVAGPAITPPEDSPKQEASGEIFASVSSSGVYAYRYTPSKERFVDDYPSCNFLVRKSVMDELGGFKTSFWPGEDTKLCLVITKKLKKKILYDPQVLVWHHRRALFLPHLRQITNYAMHRGYFVKKYPETSTRITYFLPSLFVLWLYIAGAASLFWPLLRAVYLVILLIYLLTILIFSIIPRKPKIMYLIFLGIIMTHFAYGVFFIKGLLSSKMLEE